MSPGSCPGSSRRTSPTDVDLRFLRANGLVDVAFHDLEPLHEVQRIVRSFFPGPPEDWHVTPPAQDARVALDKAITDALAATDVGTTLVLRNAAPLREILGPDIDVQAIRLAPPAGSR